MPGRILVFACCLLASLARSEPRHAITLYDEPAKYPPGFQHFDFVDPQAPKGGSLRRMESGSFDTLNPFANRGTPISMTQAALIYETLGFQSLDEPFTEYGYWRATSRKPRTTAGCVSISIRERASATAWRSPPRT